MAAYKFPVKDAIYQEGYTYLVVKGGQAEVDKNDPLQISLALKNGGVPAPAPEMQTPIVVKKRSTKRGEV